MAMSKLFNPLSLVRDTCAPWLMSSSTTFRWPSWQASCSGVTWITFLSTCYMFSHVATITNKIIDTRNYNKTNSKSLNKSPGVYFLSKIFRRVPISIWVHSQINIIILLPAGLTPGINLRELSIQERRRLFKIYDTCIIIQTQKLMVHSLSVWFCVFVCCYSYVISVEWFQISISINEKLYHFGPSSLSSTIQWSPTDDISEWKIVCNHVYLLKLLFRMHSYSNYHTIIDQQHICAVAFWNLGPFFAHCGSLFPMFTFIHASSWFFPTKISKRSEPWLPSYTARKHLKVFAAQAPDFRTELDARYTLLKTQLMSSKQHVLLWYLYLASGSDLLSSNSLATS